MNDWRKELSDIRWKVAADEKKRKKEQCEREKAKRLRKEDRMRQAVRLMSKPPQRDVREPVNQQAARLLQKASSYSKLKS